MVTLSIVDTALSLTINKDQNLLEQCLAATLPVTRSCRNGNCGRCDSKLLQGQVRLRNGNLLQSPATVPLCIAYAIEDLQISDIPLSQLPSHWRCQRQSPQQLLLPAGRQTPPLQGDICAILFVNGVEVNEIAHVAGRSIALTNPSAITAENSVVSLITIDRDHSGQFTLWREHQNHRQLLWANINQTTALSAQAAYQQSSGVGKYIVSNDA
ncbi:2Fe-2S iron-sulfur cluster-binding protein [Zhongshania aquimaris]|uniref:2Fe-2S iron-sulfur cluster binding domain-containing protein n=1 Tax=Zhongshania aquimaris TaxID=2857107 RepID=A0ABS6VU80_9GAMM|nr:2Fe-2S iron-sulfur cluster-binding protein [Zhongshania aquimaris]MBW2941261.1 2Fe-2S iron-sulfur cluster binding domain-containing protein [Zhongshania aquimaris]